MFDIIDFNIFEASNTAQHAMWQNVINSMYFFSKFQQVIDCIKKKITCFIVLITLVHGVVVLGGREWIGAKKLFSEKNFIENPVWLPKNIKNTCLKPTLHIFITPRVKMLDHCDSVAELTTIRTSYVHSMKFCIKLSTEIWLCQNGSAQPLK